MCFLYYTFTIECVATGAQNMHIISIGYALFVTNNLQKHLFISVFKKYIPDATSTTFQEVAGVTLPFIVCGSVRFSHCIT